MMIYYKTKHLKILLLSLLICLSGQLLEAQKLGSLYTLQQHERTEYFIEKGTDLKEALEIIEDHFNVGLLYQSEVVEGVKISVTTSLPKEVDKALELLLAESGLNYKYLNPKTYGIFESNGNASEIQDSEVVQQNISGTIFDAQSGEPLPGVNIVVQGAEEATGNIIGTTSDIDGNYSLTVPDDLNVIVATYVGYIRQEIEINGRSEIDIQLEPDVTTLDDVVVVGYGTQERKQITGSVSSVSADEFVSGNVNDASGLIQGKIPGLIISNPGGNPNQEATIRLRGVTTFGANQDPLVVVDGIAGASLNNIDPNDIESIDVLKDASAAAIYGTRGAAGVILVTTKTGNAGNTNVSYNGSVSSVGIENRIHVLSGEEYRNLGNDIGVEILDFGADTDWFDAITRRGANTIHNIAISGGNSSTTYRVSGNFRNADGLLKTTGFEQKNGRLNINHRALNDKLSLTLNLSGTDRTENRGFESAFEQAITFNPTVTSETSEEFRTTGGYQQIQIQGVANPLATLKTADNKADERRFNGAFRAEYYFDDLLPGLSTSLFYSFSTYNELNNLFFDRTNFNQGGASLANFGNGRLERHSYDDKNELYEATANYTTTLQNLNLEVLGGFSYQDFTSSGTSVAGGNILPIGLGAANLEFSQDFNEGLGEISSYENSNTLVAGFGRVNFNVNDTYFINSSIRREGSSRFGENEKWGIFWSAGLGIELTNLINLGEKMNSLRLRSSYGVTGQDAPFDGISRLRFAPTGNFFVGGEYIQSFGPVSNNNPDLKWEENKELNIGLEFLAFDERLSGTVEYYSKNTSDLLFETEVPVPPNLFPTTWLNVGELKNEGFEAALSYDILRKQDFFWSSGVTFSSYNTRLVEFVTDQARYISNLGSPGQEQRPLIRISEGEPLGQIYGPDFARIGDDGIWLFYNNEGEEVTIDQISRDDEKVIGNALPDFTFSWDNTVNYKNWDMRMLFRGAIGHDLVNTYRAFFENPINISSRNVLKSALDLKNLESQSSFNSFHVENASFARLENLSLGYTFSLPNLEQVRRLRLSVSANNLFTITGYDGIDPEVRYVDPNGGPLAPGIERRNQWFTSRSFTLGVNLDF